MRNRSWWLTGRDIKERSWCPIRVREGNGSVDVLVMSVTRTLRMVVVLVKECITD